MNYNITIPPCPTDRNQHPVHCLCLGYAWPSFPNNCRGSRTEKSRHFSSRRSFTSGSPVISWFSGQWLCSTHSVEILQIKMFSLETQRSHDSNPSWLSGRGGVSSNDPGVPKSTVEIGVLGSSSVSASSRLGWWSSPSGVSLRLKQHKRIPLLTCDMIQ